MEYGNNPADILIYISSMAEEQTLTPSPLTLDSLVGYIEAENIYITFSEYYGDGTIYGRRNLLYPSGEVVHDAGKTKKELVDLGVLVSSEQFGSIPGDLKVVPTEVPVEVPAEVRAEVPVEVPVEVPTEVPVEVPAEVPVEVPADSSKKTYIVKIVHADFSVEYKNVSSVEVFNTTNTLAFSAK